MEERLVRSDIKSCESIYFHRDHYLFSGKYVRSCSKQGGALSEYPGVRYYLAAMAVLPDSKLLVHGGKAMYHILDLNTGKVLASQKMPRDVISTDRFAVSGDGKTAFRIWLRGRKYYLVIIDLSDLSYRTCLYRASLYRVADLVYNAEKGLLALETQVDEDGTCRNQVTSVRVEDGECNIVPLHTWSGKNIAEFFDGRFVWESGYMIRDLQTGEVFSLLENSDIRLPEKHVALSHIYYPEEKYLQLIDRTQNIFIDCEKRKIIARYLTDPQKVGYKGILAGNEFWIGRPDGIYAKPFPVVEGV